MANNWYCNNCNSYQKSWAEYQSYKPTETYRRDIRCWSCNEWFLTYTDSQKSRYKELVKERTSIPGTICEVERFSTWWSNNIAAVISYYNSYYWVFLLVYDKQSDAVKVFPEYVSCRHWGDWEFSRYNQWWSVLAASGEVNLLKLELIEEGGKYYNNPILLLHPYCDSYRSFESFVKKPYVIRKEVPSETSARPNIHLFLPLPLNPITIKHHYPSNPSSYLKPLDIVKVKCIDCILSPSIPLNLTGGEYFYHVGVYLGKIDGEYKVCHFTKSVNGTRVHSWKKFLEGGSGELVRYRSIIPFKHYSKIARQIAWAKKENFREDDYNLPNKNCEHFANMLVYGINYSEQVEEKKEIISLFQKSIGCILIGQTINNDKGSTIKLTSEVSKTNGIGEWYNSLSEEIERQYLQEIPPKQECRIM